MSMGRTRTVSVVLLSTIMVLVIINRLYDVREHEQVKLVDYMEEPRILLSKQKCLGSTKGQAEDLFCRYKHEYLPNYKNPCWRSMGKLRCLPYFQLIGSDKCGSTDLFSRITNHPEVERCRCVIGKESWYWSWSRYGISHAGGSAVETFDNYIDKFSKAAVTINNTAINGYHPKIVGDGTPMDFWEFRGWKKIPQNFELAEPEVLTPHIMQHVYGPMKFILIFRNPIDRLYSDYYFLRYGDSPESFHKHVQESVKMISECMETKSIRQCLYSNEMYKKLPTRIHIGCYSVFLREWLSVFPRDYFLILRTEDYKTGMEKTLHDVFQFLNITSPDAKLMIDITSAGYKHQTKSKKSAPPMFEETRNILSEFYKSYNNELAEMLNDNRFLWM